MYAVTAFVAGPVYQRLGVKRIVAAGTLITAIGCFLLSLIQVDTTYSSLVAGLVVTGIGFGFFYPSVTTAAVTALDPSHSSLAGGLVQMFQIAGGALGLGMTTMIFSTVGNATAAQAPTVLAAHQAFVHGLQISFRVVAAIALGGFVLSLSYVGGTIGKRRPRPAGAPPVA